MQSFELLESDQFKAELEEAALWLYTHNLEQSQEFADRKFLELERDINDLKSHLRKTPYIGQADEVSGIRRFPLYGGRYMATWILNEDAKTLILLEFFDVKYPQKLREVHFDE